MDDNKLVLFWILVVLVFLTVVIFRGAWVDKSEAVRALETQGYSNIQISDHNWFFVGFRGCENSDAAQFYANATNPAGKQVRLFVCVGWPFKGATIRTK
jgi:hypothetical protein